MDIARKESEGVSDKMAELDGDDDMLQVPQKSPPQKSPTKEPYSRDGAAKVPQKSPTKKRARPLRHR